MVAVTSMSILGFLDGVGFHLCLHRGERDVPVDHPARFVPGLLVSQASVDSPVTEVPVLSGEFGIWLNS